MNSTIRTRFAPSPTGYLHVGSARTALFSWLYAKHHNGSFILRIEDTDRERSTQASIDTILHSMEWLGLDYQEGPYYQTQHFDRYRDVIQQLLDNGHAYRCTCSKERLTQLREQQQAAKQKPRYDGHCRDANHPATSSDPFVIRFRNPTEGHVNFTDAVRGDISIANSELDDLIIARSDGTPTYNLTVVIDDWDMKITDVIRGDDHINNTPRQINILTALGADIPRYAHVPMILGGDGKRLSKRHGAVSVMQYHEDGFLPEALLNYLVRLGWSHGDQEIFTLDDMIQAFNLDSISHSPAVFDTEKLTWLNQHYLKTLPTDYIARELQQQLTQHYHITPKAPPALTDIVNVQAERSKTLRDMAERSQYFYQTADKIQYDEKATRKHLKPEIKTALTIVHDRMQSLASWDAEALHQIIIDVAEELNLKLGKLAQPIRVAVTGNTASPPMDITLQLIGKEEVLSRLNGVIERLAT